MKKPITARFDDLVITVKNLFRFSLSWFQQLCETTTIEAHIPLNEFKNSKFIWILSEAETSDFESAFGFCFFPDSDLICLKIGYAFRKKITS